MNALATKIGVNSAALAVAAAATIIPMQAAAQAAPVSTYASQWSQSLETTFSNIAEAPLFCIGTVQSCITPDSTVLFAIDFAAFARLIPFVGDFIAAVISQFKIAGCFFGVCGQVGPYDSQA